MTKVHHLFPPLAFLMDACLDLFDEDVQREVASPFMTQVKLMMMVMVVMVMRRRKRILSSKCCETLIQNLQKSEKARRANKRIYKLKPCPQSSWHAFFSKKNNKES